MIRLHALAAAFYLAACATAPGVPPETPYDSDEAQRRFDALAKGFPALNATVRVDGSVVWEAEGGLSRDERDGVETDYNIYSIAKMLTGIAFARLESEGAIDVDQSIRLIDQRLPSAFEDVTLRHLLSHTSGLRHYKSDQDWIVFSEMRCQKPQDALGHFIEDPLIATPGDRYKYSTFGFTLLSHLLVQITGETSYDAAMNAVLGEHFRAATDSDGADKALNYTGDPGAYEEISLSAECKYGGGGLLSSARNLSQIGAALASGNIVPLDFAKEHFVPGKSGNGKVLNYVYGMSVGFSESIKAHYSTHSGGSPGGRGFLLVFYEPRVSVALTSNFDGPHHSDLATALGRIFSGAPAEAESSGE